MARAQRTVSKRAIMRAGGLAVGLVLLLLSSCSLDIQNPGAITEDSLNDASLMRVVVNGIANEFNTMVEALEVRDRIRDEPSLLSGSHAPYNGA